MVSEPICKLESSVAEAKRNFEALCRQQFETLRGSGVPFGQQGRFFRKKLFRLRELTTNKFSKSKITRGKGSNNIFLPKQMFSWDAVILQ